MTDRLRRFEGKRVLVTGASKGIGRACALRFASEGAEVIGTWAGDTAAAEGAQAADRAAGRSITLVRAALGDRDQTEALWRGLGPRGVDVLVLNAAFQKKATLTETDLDLFTRTLAVNVVGNADLAQRFIAGCRAAKRPGTVVVHSSNQGEFVNPTGYAYGVSKAALNHLVRHLAQATAGEGIRVNGVILGWFDTEGERGFYSAQQIAAQAASGIPMGRAGDPAEAAELTAFLASAQSAYMTGSLVRLDGGFALDPDLGT